VLLKKAADFSELESRLSPAGTGFPAAPAAGGVPGTAFALPRPSESELAKNRRRPIAAAPPVAFYKVARWHRFARIWERYCPGGALFTGTILTLP
jgi:hypothetical protein